MKKNVLRLFAFFLVLFISAQTLAQTELPPDLDAYFARALKEFEVPGLAIAAALAILVDEGKISWDDFIKERIFAPLFLVIVCPLQAQVFARPRAEED